jgi:sugar lactone lactonase YvrE
MKNNQYMIALVLSCLAVHSALAQQNGSYPVTESWSVTTQIGNGTSITSTTYTGTETGTLVINNGSYTQINHTGISSLGGLNTTRTIYYGGNSYNITGAYPCSAIASGPGNIYAVIQLSFFVILVPLGTQADIPSVYPYKSSVFTTTGTSLTSLSGAGKMVDQNAPSSESGYVNEVDASSTAALTLPPPDTTPPTITITSPTPGQLWSNAAFTVMGTAADNVAVASVYCSLSNSAGAGPWTLASTANNWANWSATVTLTPGTNTIRACAVDTSGNVSTTNTVNIDGVFSAPLTVTIVALPSGTTNVAYSQTLTASGGKPPYTWTNISGALPPGLSLATNGLISGTPTANGTFNFTVKVTDALSATDTQALSLTVLAPNLVLNGGFEMGTFSGWTSSGNFTYTTVVTGAAYAHSGTYGAQLGPSGSLGYISQTLATTAGKSYLLSFWLDSPNGQTPNEFLVSWNGTTLFDQPNLGAVGWTNLQFLVSATGTSTVLQFGFRDDPSYLGLDDISVVASQPAQLTVTTASLPNGTNSVAYSQTLAASGGQMPYTWSLVSSLLPSGLTLATNGVISGTPTNSGTFNFTVKVTDALSATATQSLTLTVFGPPIVTLQPTNNLIWVPVGSNVTFSVSVTGTGPFSYQWQLNGTNLPSGIIITVAGNGTNGFSGDGGAATNAELRRPSGVAVDATGNLFIADCNNQRIRKVSTNGIINTVAGNGTGGYYGDGGVATNAELYSPSGVAVDTTGNLFIADYYNNRIRKVGTNGIISTLAGNGTNGYAGDGGVATNAELSDPEGAAVDASGKLFIADVRNNRIREVGTNGIITTVAGNGYGSPSSGGYSGDGGAAANAELFCPSGVAVDVTGNLFIADEVNSRIRKVETNGIITTVAGNGYVNPNTGYGGYSGDGGAATNAELNFPFRVAVDATGNLFIADYYNNRIRKVGTNGIITTVAGNGTNGYSGDGGAATNAELYYPNDVAVDTTGNLFISDQSNNRIRKVVIQGPALVLNNVGFGNAGAYDVVVSGPYGSVTSSVVNVTVTIPVILSTPKITVGKTNFTFQLSGPAGSNFVVQVSTNLLNWDPIRTSAIPVSGTINLTNAITNYNRRFYKVHLQ